MENAAKAVAGYAAESTQPKRAVAPGKTRVSPDEPLAIIGTACAFPGFLVFYGFLMVSGFLGFWVFGCQKFESLLLTSDSDWSCCKVDLTVLQSSGHCWHWAQMVLLRWACPIELDSAVHGPEHIRTH